MASLPLITPSECAVVLVDYQGRPGIRRRLVRSPGHSQCGVGARQDCRGVLGAGGGQYVGDQGLQRAVDTAAARCPGRRKYRSIMSRSRSAPLIFRRV
jgi:hypothetical protein